MNQQYDPTDISMASGSEAATREPETAPEAATRKAARVAEEAKQAGKEKGRALLSEQKGGAAKMLSDVATALHSSARQLKDQAHPSTARYLDWAADGLEDFADALNSREPETLLADIRDFARRQPAVWIAGSLLAGVFIARLAKTGVETKQTEESEPVGTQETLLH